MVINLELFEHLIHHQVEGVLWQQEQNVTLVIDRPDLVLKGRVLIRGMIVLRYGIPFQGPKHLSVIPSIFLSERGGMLTGWQGWNFICKNYQLHQRAEIFGLQSDGETAQVFVRALDFAANPHVFAYQNAADKKPIAQINHLIAQDTSTIPHLLVEILSS
jgi:hypothetical protein